MYKALLLRISLLFLPYQITQINAVCDQGPCGLGQFFQTSSNTCVPCLNGMFMDKTNHSCLACSKCTIPEEGTPEILKETCTPTKDAVTDYRPGHKRVERLCKPSKDATATLEKEIPAAMQTRHQTIPPVHLTSAHSTNPVSGCRPSAYPTQPHIVIFLFLNNFFLKY